jgi:UDP-N-acetylmuramyl tripeptide synthase
MTTALDVKVAAARAAGVLSRRAGRGGTSLPGKVLMRLDPHAIARLAARLERGSAVISATNGKTTTAAMAAEILERAGARLVHNRAGANMAGGVATALMDGPRDADTGLFEVDEFWLDQVVDDLRPRALLLANLFRDQLDRYGELDSIADRWAAVAARTPAALVLNADDPTVADLGRMREPGGSGPPGRAREPDGPGPPGRAREPEAGGGARVTYFGVDDDAMALPAMQHAADAKHCRRCGAPYRYDAVYLGHLGRYHCDSCGATRPEPQIAATDIVLEGVRGARFTLRTPAGERAIALPLPGLYNVYNALAAAALTLALGATLDRVAAGLQAVSPAFGRAETLRVAHRELSILLVKNPAGANEVLRTLTLEDGEHDVFAVLNDNIADGRDVSWVWDADFEVLAPRVRRATCSGTRAAEMALRLKYAGVPTERIAVEPDLDAGLDRALRDGDGRLFALPTYTAMLALREALVARGAARGSFAPAPAASPGPGPFEGRNS